MTQDQTTQSDIVSRTFVRILDEVFVKFTKRTNVDTLGYALCLRYMDSDTSRLFTTDGLTELTNTIGNSGVHDFLVEIGEHMSLAMAVDTVQDSPIFSVWLSEKMAVLLSKDKEACAIGAVSGEVSYVLDYEKAVGRYVKYNEVKSRLLNNKWLLMYCLFIVLFPQTRVYKDMMEETIKKLKEMKK